MHFGLLVSVGARLLHPRELQDRLQRSHAAVRYSEEASLIFSAAGAILDQNPASLPYFGMCCGSLRGTEVEDDGTPVNRLRALLGDSYESVMAAMARDKEWSGRIEVTRAQLKPWQDDSEDEKGGGGGHTTIFRPVLNAIRDPADGQPVIHASFRNVTEQVRAERKIER